MTSRLPKRALLWTLLMSSIAGAHPEIKQFTLVPTRVVAPDAKHAQPRLIIVGRYPRAEWSLRVSGKPIPRDKKGYFHVIAPLAGDSLKLPFAASGPGGKLEETTGDFFIPSWQKFKPPVDIAPELLEEEKSALASLEEPKEIAAETKAKPLTFAFGLGYASFGYSQTGYADVSVSALSGNVGLKYQLLPQTELLLEALMYLLPLSSQPPDSHPRYAGADLGAAEKWEWPEHWALREALTYHFEDLLIPDDLNGFHNVNGPRLRSTAEYRWGEGNAVGVSLTLGLYRSNDSAGFFHNLFWAGGVEYSRALKASGMLHQIGAELEYGHTHLQFAEGEINVHALLCNTRVSF